MANSHRGVDGMFGGWNFRGMNLRTILSAVPLWALSWLLPVAFLSGPGLWLYASALIYRPEGSSPGTRLWFELTSGRTLLLNTMALGLWSAAVSLLLALPLAIALTRGPHSWRAWLAAGAIMPLALPPTLVATAWLQVTSSPPARAMASLGANQSLTVSSLLVGGPVLALSYFPLAVFVLAAGLRALDPGEEEAGRLLHRGWRLWRGLMLPRLMPAIATAVTAIMALAAWEMGAPDLLDVRTYSVVIYRNLNAPLGLNPQQIAAAAALSALPVIVLTALCMAVALKLLARHLPGTIAALEARSYPGHAAKWALPLALLVLFISPVGVLLVYLQQLQPASVFRTVWESNRVEIFNTLYLAGGTSFLMCLIAAGMVLSWQHWSARGRSLAVFSTMVPLVLPPLLTGIALIQFYNRPAFALFYGGVMAPGWGEPITTAFARYSMTIIGYLGRFLPLAVLALYLTGRQVPESSREAAIALGASPLHATGTALWPQLKSLWPGLQGMLFALCAGELATTVLVNPPGGQTLPVPVFQLMHIGSTAEVAALCLTLAGMSGLVLLLATIITARMVTGARVRP